MKVIFLYLFTAHIIGDYYLQDQYTADNKHHDEKLFYNHLLMYILPFAVFAVLLKFELNFIIASALAVLAHGVIDIGKRKLVKGKKKYKDSNIYVFDQALHILSLIIIATVFRRTHLSFFGFIADFFYEFWVEPYQAAKWLLAFLLIYKPSNITFTVLFSQFKPAEDKSIIKENSIVDTEVSSEIAERSNLKAGGIIGVLEKTICLILMSLGEYAAVGLVLTAKSIARYDRISKDPVFAEYYLIGTLSSIIMVFMIYILCFQLLM
ncbi:MAG: DUF3307 domain-containing protein [Clostridiaceae bacterium]